MSKLLGNPFLVFSTKNAREAIETGEVTATVRHGLAHCMIGQFVVLGCAFVSWCRLTKVTNVWRGILRDAPVDLLERAGYNSPAHAVGMLRSVPHDDYRRMNEGSEVTIVVWDELEALTADDRPGAGTVKPETKTTKKAGKKKTGRRGTPDGSE